MPTIINFLPNSSLIKTVNNIYFIYNNRRFSQLNYVDLNNTNMLNSKIDAWTKLSSAFSQFKNTLDTLIQQGIKPYSIYYSKSGYVTADINNDGEEEELLIRVLQKAKNHIVESDAQASATTALGLSGSFGINGIYITVEATDTLEDIRDKINAADNTGVTAGIYNLRLRFTAQETGTENQVSLQDPDNILHTLGFLVDDSFGNPQLKNELQAAQDAVIYVNGQRYTSSENSITVNDVNISILSNTPGQLMIKVEENVNDAYSQIEYFVEKFNDLVDDMNRYLKADESLFNDRALQIIREKMYSIISNEYDSIPDYRNELGEIGIQQNSSGIVTFTEAHLDILRTWQDEIEETTPQAIDSVVNDIRSLEQVGIISTENGKLEIDRTQLTKYLSNYFTDIESMLFGDDNGVLPRLKQLFEDVLNETYGSVSFRQELYSEYIENLTSNEYKRMIETYASLDALVQKNYFLPLLLNFA